MPAAPAWEFGSSVVATLEVPRGRRVQGFRGIRVGTVPRRGGSTIQPAGGCCRSSAHRIDYLGGRSEAGADRRGARALRADRVGRATRRRRRPVRLNWELPTRAETRWLLSGILMAALPEGSYRAAAVRWRRAVPATAPGGMAKAGDSAAFDGELYCRGATAPSTSRRCSPPTARAVIAARCTARRAGRSS